VTEGTRAARLPPGLIRFASTDHAHGKGDTLTPVAPIGIGTSLVLITVGAILKYAINEGEIFFLDIDAAGTILMIVGIIGLVLAVVYTMILTNRRRDPEVVREREYYDEPTRRRERY
jgi:hypothetical protein